MVYVHWSICSLKSGKVANYLCVSCTLHNIWDIKSTLSNVANYLNSWSTEVRIFIGRFDSLFTHEIYVCVCVCVCVYLLQIFTVLIHLLQIFICYLYIIMSFYINMIFFHFLISSLISLFENPFASTDFINFNLFSFKITFQSILLINLARISFMMWKYLWLFSPKQVT